MSHRLNDYPLETAKDIIQFNKNKKEDLEGHIKDLEQYEQELMERLLLVRSELNDAKLLLEKETAKGQDK